MDAITLLKKDHQTVEKLFKQIQKSEDDLEACQELFNTLMEAFMLHGEVEEKIFYPACKEKEALKDQILEALEEHKQVKYMLKESHKKKPNAESWMAALTVIQEDIEHHVQEEESNLFVKVQEIFSKEELQRLGQEIQAYKESAREPVTA